MSPVEEHVRLAGSRFFAQWEMCGDIRSRGSPGSSEQRQMQGSLGQGGVTAQGPGAGSGKGFLRRGEGKGQVREATLDSRSKQGPSRAADTKG